MIILSSRQFQVQPVITQSHWLPFSATTNLVDAVQSRLAFPFSIHTMFFITFDIVSSQKRRRTKHNISVRDRLYSSCILGRRAWCYISVFLFSTSIIEKRKYVWPIPFLFFLCKLGKGKIKLSLFSLFFELGKRKTKGRYIHGPFRERSGLFYFG